MRLVCNSQPKELILLSKTLFSTEVHAFQVLSASYQVGIMNCFVHARECTDHWM